MEAAAVEEEEGEGEMAEEIDAVPQYTITNLMRLEGMDYFFMLGYCFVLSDLYGCECCV